MKWKGLNVPESWHDMPFVAKLSYCVETYQAKDHKAARALIVKPKQPKPTPVVARLPYKDE